MIERQPSARSNALKRTNSVTSASWKEQRAHSLIVLIKLVAFALSFALFLSASLSTLIDLRLFSGQQERKWNKEREKQWKHKQSWIEQASWQIDASTNYNQTKCSLTFARQTHRDKSRATDNTSRILFTTKSLLFNATNKQQQQQH